MKKNSFAALLFILTLNACGGGSGTLESDVVVPAPTQPTTSNGNQAPIFIDPPNVVAVNENQTQITTFNATDDDDDNLIFTLQGSDAELLQITQEGALTFQSAPDFETKDSYAVNIEVSDGVASTNHALAINIIDVAETVSQAPVELAVIVQAVSSGYSSSNKYSVDGEITPTLTLARGKTYRFLQSSTSNSNHPLRFSLTSNGIHNNGTTITDGVSVVGNAGSTGAYTQIQIAADSNLTTLFYFCSNHSGMGGEITISTASSSGYLVTPRLY